MSLDCRASIHTPAPRLGLPQSLAAEALLARVLAPLPLRAFFPDGSAIGAGRATSPAVVITAPRAMAARLAINPEVGLGEAFVAGDWHLAPSSDLVDVLRILAPALGLFTHPSQGLGPVLAGRLLGRAGRATAQAARGADLYPLLTRALAELAASDITRAGVPAGSRVLEISGGWPTSVIAAARRGAHVTALTQDRLAAQRLTVAADAAGVEQLVETLSPQSLPRSARFDAVIGSGALLGAVSGDWRSVLDSVEERLLPGGIASLDTLVSVDAGSPKRATWLGTYLENGRDLASLAELKEYVCSRSDIQRATVTAGPPEAQRSFAQLRAVARTDRGTAVGESIHPTIIRAVDYTLAWVVAGLSAQRFEVVTITLVKGGTLRVTALDQDQEIASFLVNDHHSA